MRKTRLLILCAGIVLAMGSGPGWTQSPAGAFPSKPVTIVIAVAPGASADIETRLYMPRLMEGLGQPIILDYKPGAATSIGTIYVARATPDGHTILYASSGFPVYPAFFPADKLPYDPVKDFAAVSLITKRGTLLLVHPSLGVKTFAEYLAYAKANPEKINFGTSGGGGIFHIIGAWLHSLTNTKVTFVHYKGAAPIYVDLLAGRIAAAPAVMFVGLPHVKSGKLIPIANMSAERSRQMPDLRTLTELGVTGYDFASWSGYVAPARTPEAVVNRLSAEFAKVARAPEVIKRMDADGADMIGSTPEQFRQAILNETIRWRRVVQDNGIKLEE